METQEITDLFRAAGIGLELVYAGPRMGCPHCDNLEAAGLAQAA